MPAMVIFNALIQRERLGSGGIMRVAIPNAVFAELIQGVVTITTIETAVAFVAHDIIPVDIVFTAPGPDQANGDHLKLVSAAQHNILRRGPYVRCYEAPKLHWI